MAKLVTRKAKYGEAAGLIALVKSFKASVLGCVATATCCIHDQKYLAPEFVKICFCATNICDFRGVVYFHKKLRTSRVYANKSER